MYEENVTDLASIFKLNFTFYYENTYLLNRASPKNFGLPFKHF